jgi:hypothetical protein
MLRDSTAPSNSLLAAFQEIWSRPHVVEDLRALQARIPANDELQPQIAFVLLKQKTILPSFDHQGRQAV